MAARQAINFTILALVALGFSVLPGGNATLNVLLTLLGIVFFAAIAMLGYRLYREHRFTLDSLAERERLLAVAPGGLGVPPSVGGRGPCHPPRGRRGAGGPG